MTRNLLIRTKMCLSHYFSLQASTVDSFSVTADQIHVFMYIVTCCKLSEGEQHTSAGGQR